jgi:pimeloyl-ACP methyl ester carboxylesterase
MTIVKEEVVTLAGWPTDIVRVDHPASNTSRQQHPRRTILVFIPGNPGCIGWYQQNLVELVERLGPGFAARGVSYAGHSPTQALTQVDARKSRDIPWTVDGQIEHKCAFLDFILSEEDKSGETKNDPPRLLFLSHSIGSHMVQRLCIIRPDLLARTIGILSV